MKPETVALRQRVFDLLGGMCVWPGCEVRDYDELQLDHIADDGAEDRRQHQERGAAKYQRFLSRYPEHGADGKQLLCGMHNLAKAQRLAQIVGTTMPNNGNESSAHDGQEAPGAPKRLLYRANVLPTTEKALRQRVEQTGQNNGQVVDDLVQFVGALGKVNEVLAGQARIEVKLDQLLARLVGAEPSSAPDTPTTKTFDFLQASAIAKQEADYQARRLDSRPCASGKMMQLWQWVLGL